MPAGLTQRSGAIGLRQGGVRQQRAGGRSLAVGARAQQASQKPLWLPGSDPPEHLPQDIPGYAGFDPLNLASEENALHWLRQAELVHCRWAMLGVAGILGTDLLNSVRASKGSQQCRNGLMAILLTLDRPLKNAQAGVASLPNWWEAGASEQFRQDPLSLFWVQMVLFNFAEVRRWQDIRKPGSVNDDPIFKKFRVPGTEPGYPGGTWFDPLGFANRPDFATLKDKEIANGRLAMVAFVGLAVQAAATKEGPIANLKEHIANPGYTTFTQWLQ